MYHFIDIVFLVGVRSQNHRSLFYCLFYMVIKLNIRILHINVDFKNNSSFSSVVTKINILTAVNKMKMDLPCALQTWCTPLSLLVGAIQFHDNQRSRGTDRLAQGLGVSSTSTIK